MNLKFDEIVSQRVVIINYEDTSGKMLSKIKKNIVYLFPSSFLFLISKFCNISKKNGTIISL